MSEPKKNSPPKAFISYSWTTPEHEEKVLKLAEDLVHSGVDVILDKWDLKEGHDAYKFMEKMVTDPDVQKVILVCDKAYQSKADKRKGGVGTEAQIISPEIYNNATQDKFVALVFEHDDAGQPCVPAYYKSRIHIDYSDSDNEGTQFSILLRWIFDKPIFQKPELGKPPSYISGESVTVSTKTSAALKRLQESLKKGNTNYIPMLEDFLEKLLEVVDDFHADLTAEHIDDDIVSKIENFIPYRNDFLTAIQTVLRYSEKRDYISLIIKFFERFLEKTLPKEGKQSTNQFEYDVEKFLLHELFLYTVAATIRQPNLSDTKRLLAANFLYRGWGQTTEMKDSAIVQQAVGSLSFRNRRLKLSRVSIYADLLKDRAIGLKLSHDELMQSDFILYLYHNIHSEDRMRFKWFPVSLLYATDYHKKFVFFVRAEVPEGRDELVELLGLEDFSILEEFVKQIQSQTIAIPRFTGPFNTVPVQSLLNFDKIK